MKCLSCGTEVADDLEFCHQCGVKLEKKKDEVIELIEENSPTSDAQSVDKDKKFIKKLISQEWNKLSVFGKIMTIFIAVCVLFFLIALICGKRFAATLSLIQICLLGISWLMKNEIIKTKKSNLYISLICIAVVVFIPYFGTLSSTKKENSRPTYNVQESVSSDTDDEVKVFNDLIWPDSELVKQLPMPESMKGDVLWEYLNEVNIRVEETSKEDYEEYIVACLESGFSTVISEGDKFYNAKNEEGYRLSLSYTDEQAMIINIKKPLFSVQVELDCTENLLFNKYDVLVYVENEKIGTLEHGESNTFEVELEKGKYTVKVAKEDEISVDGTATIEVSENVKYSYSILCQGEQVKITEEYIETLDELEEGQVKVPQSAGEYNSKIYADVVSELTNAGFTNIKENIIRDLTGSWLDTDGEIESISIDGRTDFRKSEVFDSDAEIIITYHTFEPSDDEMWDKIIDKVGQSALDIIKSFDGTGYEVICYFNDEIITDYTQEEYIFESGWLDTDEKVAHLNLTTEELQAMIAQLEETFPKEYAKRVTVVAMTNCQATDVFKSDGNTYDSSKFHSYSDLSGFYLTIVDEGTWKAVDENTWHVDEMKCMMSETGTYLKASLDVSFDGDHYVVSNVDKTIASKDYIDSDDMSMVDIEHLEPTESRPYLTVSFGLIEDDRDFVEEEEQNNRTLPTDERTSWIENQFDWWDGAHIELERLIRDSLNDEKSYKHVETTYIDVFNEENQRIVNDVISNMGYRVEIGDLFVVTDFTAKNVFDATIKSTAYGIVSYEDNTVTLIGIE